MLKANKPLIDARSLIIGLAFQCPMGKSLKGCVLQDIRKMMQNKNPKIAIQLINEMLEDDLDNLVKFHQQCLEKREC